MLDRTQVWSLALSATTMIFSNYRLAWETSYGFSKVGTRTLEGTFIPSPVVVARDTLAADTLLGSIFPSGERVLDGAGPFLRGAGQRDHMLEILDGADGR